MVESRAIVLDDVELEVFLDGPESSDLVIAAAHPADSFDAGTAALLAETAGARAVCINPQGSPASETAPSLDRMVERIDAVRSRLGIERWLFWGMSGGGWLAQIYGHRHPEALAGIVIESACLCFRERLADPECVLSPFFPAWREPLRGAGLLAPRSHLSPSPGEGAEWVEVGGVGHVFRRRGGPALVVSPAELDPAMKRVMPRLWEFDARPWVGSVRVPALVLCGSSDPVLPARHARAVHDAIAGSTFVEIEGAGHVPTSERRPEVAAALARFRSTL
jgi:pimeloyl-ACP methyl ester carboxylesterase